MIFTLVRTYFYIFRLVFLFNTAAGRTKERKFEGKCTIQTNTVKVIPFSKLTVLKKDEFIEHVAESGIIVIEWKDNKKVVRRHNQDATGIPPVVGYCAVANRFDIRN